MMNKGFGITIDYNNKLAKKKNLHAGYYFKTTEYSTFTGNRITLCTEIFHAIFWTEKNKLMNKIFIEKLESDLVRNFKTTNQQRKLTVKR